MAAMATPGGAPGAAPAAAGSSGAMLASRMEVGTAPAAGSPPPDGPPLKFRWRRVIHDVVAYEGPERIAPEWWRSAAPGLTRDYFRVEDKNGRRFWLYREGIYVSETQNPRWFVQGLFA